MDVTVVDDFIVYKVFLKPEVCVPLWLGDDTRAAEAQTQVIAIEDMQEIVHASVDLDSISLPQGVTVTQDDNEYAPTLTFTLDKKAQEAGQVTVMIPVKVENLCTIEKPFSIYIGEVAPRGATGASGIS